VTGYLFFALALSFCPLFLLGDSSLSRENMEDAHCAVLSLPRHKDWSFFGVFDGHNGTVASTWMAEHLPTRLDALDDLKFESIIVRLKSAFSSMFLMVWIGLLSSSRFGPYQRKARGRSSRSFASSKVLVPQLTFSSQAPPLYSQF
jgi:serine/threonine protein phosphatase PrpC